MDTSSHSLERGLLPGKKRSGALVTGIIACVALLAFYLIISAVVNSRISSKTSDLQSSIDDNTKKINDNTDLIRQLQAQIADLQQQLAAQKNITNNLSDEVDTLSTTVSDLNTTVNDDIAQKITDLQSLTDDQGKQIETLNSTITTVSDDLNTLSANVQTDEANIRTLQNNVQSINTLVIPVYKSVKADDQTVHFNSFDPNNPQYTNILSEGINLNPKSDNAYGVCTFTVFSTTKSDGSNLYLAALFGTTVAGDAATFVYKDSTNIVFTAAFQIQGQQTLNFGIGLDNLDEDGLDVTFRVVDGYCNFYGVDNE
jgi:hypothetical protein